MSYPDNSELNLWCLILKSTAATNVSLEGIKSVIDSSREERRARGLSGLAVYSKGRNLGLIEGLREQVHSYFKIKLFHPIHHSISIQYDGPISQRAFKDHPLAVKIYGSRQLKKLDDFGEKSMSEYFQHFLLKNDKVSEVVRAFLEETKIKISHYR
jgi:hypothetical protein